jgi:hypothetical protein
MKNKLWGIPGKLNVYNRPKPLGEKIPLNSNAIDSWDYKKSRYKRIELVPRNNFVIQQGGVPETTSTTPLPPPSPSPTPSPTPTPVPLNWETFNINWENANINWENA